MKISFFKPIFIVFIIVPLCTTFCTMDTVPVTGSKTMSDHPIQLIITHKSSEWKVGEEIYFRLQVINRLNTPRKFSGFVMQWDELAFYGNNRAFLIGPDGSNLLKAYHVDKGSVDSSDIIEVRPEDEAWEKLTFSNLVHFHQVGKYTFYVELEDETGDLHKSNEVEFDIVMDTSGFPADKLKLNIEPGKSTYLSDERMSVTTSFMNTSDKEVRILKVHRYSIYNCVNPYYEFTLTDMNGRGVGGMIGDCDMISPLIYNEENTTVLLPNKSLIQELTLPKYVGLKEGTYRLKLHYLVYHTGVGRSLKSEPMNWGPEVFVGDIGSNQIELTVE